MSDMETVKSETEFMQESWGNLSEKLSDLLRSMLAIKKEMTTFDDLERKLEDALDFLEDELNRKGFVSALPVKCEQFEKATKVKITYFDLLCTK